MYLKKTPNSHGRIRLSIVDTYYDKAKKCSRQKTVESIGCSMNFKNSTMTRLLISQNGQRELNEEKQKKQAPIHFTFYDSDRLCIGDDLRKNFGYSALSRIYHELGIHTFLTNRQRHSKEQYDANAIMKMLVYSRLLFLLQRDLPMMVESVSLKGRIIPWMMFTDVFLFWTNTGKTCRYG